MPATERRTVTGCEVWLIGVVDELDVAEAALRATLMIVEASDRTPANGGRWRLYLRGRPMSAPPGAGPSGAGDAPTSGGPAVPDEYIHLDERGA